ncbi:hypothetical protein PPYR_05664 [Photinus pyralis]|uniref:Uncharacterized protein n=1 Tax=Photinus pyralis TaxID=7054 RepID=A0A5N4AVQ9_PHOPY|nr:hypothetical protein PPYR_05664 [Photinus pyralis]
MRPSRDCIHPSRQNRTLRLIMLITYHAAGELGRVAAVRHLSRGRRLQVRGYIGLHHAATQRIGDEHSSGSPAGAVVRALSHHQRLFTTPPQETDVFFIDFALRTAVLSIVRFHVTCQHKTHPFYRAIAKYLCLLLIKTPTLGVFIFCYAGGAGWDRFMPTKHVGFE